MSDLNEFLIEAAQNDNIGGMSKAMTFLLIVLIGMSTSCSNEVEDFENASKIGTVQAYEIFLDKHSQGEHSSIVRTKRDSLLSLTGGCTSTPDITQGSLSDEIDKIADKMEASLGVDILIDLINFLEKDTTNRSRAQPVISKILDSLVDQGEITMSAKVISDGSYLARILSFFSYYTSETLPHPEYTYELCLSREIEFLFYRTLFQIIFESMDGSSSVLNLGEGFLSGRASFQGVMGSLTRRRQLYQVAMECSSKMKEIRLEAMKDLEKDLNTCAKKQIWEFAYRLLSKQKYYSEDGIETIEEAVNIMQSSYQRERHEIIRNLSRNVLMSIDSNLVKQHEDSLTNLLQTL